MAQDGSIPVGKPRYGKTRIRKNPHNRITIHLEPEWLSPLGLKDGDRVTLHWSNEIRGHLIVGRADQMDSHGYCFSRSTGGSGRFSMTCDPKLIAHLFKNPHDLVYVPPSVKIHTRQDGTKAIALEWPGLDEFLASLGSEQQSKQEGSDAVRTKGSEKTPSPSTEVPSADGPGNPESTENRDR